MSDIKGEMYIPPADSHKGENGKLLIIGGSGLFHAASLWAAEVASRIVDMVYYSSVKENNEIFLSLKKVFRNGMVVKRSQIEEYIKEADCVLMGPGMVRSKIRDRKEKIKNLKELKDIKEEGMETRVLTDYLTCKYPKKKWVLDAGSLQMMERKWLKKLKKVLITPHKEEFLNLFKIKDKSKVGNFESRVKITEEKAKEYGCVILLKGKEDVISDGEETFVVEGGNAGMTKGGTGDVLAGLVAGLGCKNDLILAARVGSWVNKTAGERLYEKVGYYFNASDLSSEVGRILNGLI